MQSEIDNKSESSRGTWQGMRWYICALLFFATTINYIDRQILSLIKEFLDVQFGWSKAQFGLVNSLFQGAYGLGLLWFGWFVDRRGVRLGYAISMIGWSIAAMVHAFVNLLPQGHRLVVGGYVFEYTALAVGSFGFCRVLLGLAEAGNFPSAVKGVAQWFPKRERAFATSLFNAGTNVGAIVAPALVPFLALHYGWPMPFILAGVLGFLWLILWLPMYKTPELHPRVSKEELALINSDNEEGNQDKVPWLSLLSHKQTWSFIVAKFMTDPVWWFFLIWLPDFFNETLLLNIKKSWVHLVTIYTIITVLSIFGGWITGHLSKLGWSITRARKTGMFVFALCVVPVMFATHFGRFNVDAGFFDRLKASSFIVEKISVIEGKNVKEKTTLPVPAEVVVSLQTLSGKSYKTAESFIKAAGEVITPAKANEMKQALADAARDNNLFWIAVLLISLAGAAHQAWSANLYTTVSDMFPKKAVASIIGIGGMAGSMGGMIFPLVTGVLLDHFKAAGSVTAGYNILFGICAFAYLTSFVIHHFLAPRFELVDVDKKKS
jgi:ACS family hexuronate transporter-like MFS transporter